LPVLRLTARMISILISSLFLLAPADRTLDARERCRSSEDLLNLPKQDLANAAPCDLIGAAFLSGHGLQVSYMERLPRDERFQYYYVIRVFLAKNGLRTDSLDMQDTANLLAALSMLPDLQGPDERRAAYYRGFVLRQYLNVHGRGLGEQAGMLNGLSQLFAGDGTFARFSELGCFIKSDMPTATVDVVLDSLRYRECLDANNP